MKQLQALNCWDANLTVSTDENEDAWDEHVLGTFMRTARFFIGAAYHAANNRGSHRKSVAFVSYFLAHFEPELGTWVHPDRFLKIEHSSLTHREVPWPFALIQTTKEGLSKTYKPNSDSHLSVKGLPVFLCEVISMENMEDKFRLLNSAVTIAKVGYAQVGETFFVTAIYVNNRMIATRYVISVEDNNRIRPKVNIQSDDFDLQQRDQCMHLLRELFNLQKIVRKFEGKVPLHEGNNYWARFTTIASPTASKAPSRSGRISQAQPKETDGAMDVDTGPLQQSGWNVEGNVAKVSTARCNLLAQHH